MTEIVIGLAIVGVVSCAIGVGVLTLYLAAVMGDEVMRWLP